MGLQDFDARSIQPQQGLDKHPCGMFDFNITNTFLAPSKDNQHLMLNVEFTSPAGRIVRNYIVDGSSAQAIEIAQKQLSALCHATNVYRLTYPKDASGNPIFTEAARELRGGRGRMEIGWQKGEEPSAEKPAGGYVEIKKVYDVNGNEPGKSGSAPQPQQATQQQPANNGPAATQQPPQGGWGQQPAQQQPHQQANQAPANQGGGWSPGPAAGSQQQTPPWGAGK